MSKKPLWREAHLQVKMYKTRQLRTTFGSWDVEKVQAVVARSTFPSQNVQNTSASDHFWKLRCRKSARRCGTKQISKSKCTKHVSFGPLLTVQMWFCVAGGKRKGLWTLPKVSKMWRFCSSFNYNHQNTTHHHTTLHYTALHCTTLHHATLQYTTLHHTTPRYTTIHYTTSHYTTLHCNALHHTTLHYTTIHYSTIHYPTPHYTTVHYTTLDYTT